MLNIILGANPNPMMNPAMNPQNPMNQGIRMPPMNHPQNWNRPTNFTNYQNQPNMSNIPNMNTRHQIRQRMTHGSGMNNQAFPQNTYGNNFPVRVQIFYFFFNILKTSLTVKINRKFGHSNRK